VALTAPYFHDGRAPDLASAIRTMGYVQLGIQLSDKDVQLLLAFLNSLTGEIPDGVMP
jgi:cytochrome c peroxidase